MKPVLLRPIIFPMKRLEALLTKKEKLICGVMSGTSLDGIDVAVVRVSGCGTDTTFSCEAFETIPFSDAMRDDLLAMQTEQMLDDVARGNIALGFVFADAIKAVCKKHRIRMKNLDAIGLHGQTIRHAPKKKIMFGKRTGGTLQIGDPSVVAKRTGVVTIGDFRVADCAVGGEGAPLIPYIDYILFRSEKISRGLLNIGGIANITVLPKKCALGDVIGYDTGPGNMIIDSLTKRFFSRNFDRNGAIARTGKINFELYEHLLEHPYIFKPVPKSTGREMFGETFVNESLNKYKNLPPADVLRTITEFTPGCVYLSYMKFVESKTKIQELIISGGGAHNALMIERFKHMFKKVRVVTSDKYGIPVDAKEAIGFALLANETINEQPANVPRVTGATRQTILGKICL